MARTQGLTLISETCVGIKARVMLMNQEHVLKYIVIINLLDPINKAG